MRTICTCCRTAVAHGTYKVEAFSGDLHAIITPLCGDCRDGITKAKVTRV